jgi:hypothetical protein
MELEVDYEPLERMAAHHGEDAVFAALRLIAEHYGWSLTKRDPGPHPICPYCDFYEMENLMTPMHECPQPAPLEEDELASDPIMDYVMHDSGLTILKVVP